MRVREMLAFNADKRLHAFQNRAEGLVSTLMESASKVERNPKEPSREECLRELGEWCACCDVMSDE